MADEDYFYMAQLAAQQSYWVSAKNILERHPLVRANHDAEFLAEYDRMLVLVQTKSKQMIEELPKTQSQVLAGSNAVALFRLGRTQVELGKTESGLELMTRALKLGGFKNPDDYWLRLAGALAAANQREGALEALRQVASGTGGAELARLWSLFLQGPALSR